MQKWKENADTENYPRTYTRSIYNNYAYASGVTGDGKLKENNKLQVYLIYKIVIKNHHHCTWLQTK